MDLSGMCWHTEQVNGCYLVSGLDLWIVAAGDVVCLFFCTFSFVRAFFSFSFSLSLSFFSFFFLSTLKDDATPVMTTGYG